MAMSVKRRTSPIRVREAAHLIDYQGINKARCRAGVLHQRLHQRPATDPGYRLDVARAKAGEAISNGFDTTLRVLRSAIS